MTFTNFLKNLLFLLVAIFSFTMLVACDNSDGDVLDLYSVDVIEDLIKPHSDGKHPSQEFTTNVTAPLIAQFIVENYEKPLNSQTKKKNSVLDASPQ